MTAQAGGLLSALIPLVHGLSTAMVWSGTTPRYSACQAASAWHCSERGSAGGEICE